MLAIGVELAQAKPISSGFPWIREQVSPAPVERPLYNILLFSGSWKISGSKVLLYRNFSRDQPHPCARGSFAFVPAVDAQSLESFESYYYHGYAGGLASGGLNVE
jgi:hypothetical protein